MYFRDTAATNYNRRFYRAYVGGLAPSELTNGFDRISFGHSGLR